MVFHRISARLAGGYRKISAAILGSQWGPEELQPLCDLSFPADKIMERLPHGALMPTPTVVLRAVDPTPACLQHPIGQAHCMDLLRPPCTLAGWL